MSGLTGLFPEILEAQGHREILRAHGGDDGLQLVPVPARNADFFALNLGGYLEFAVADEAGDLFGDGRFDALLDGDELPGMAERRKVWLAFINVFEADGMATAK